MKAQIENAPVQKSVVANAKTVTVSAKWYGGRWNRWKLNVEGEAFSYTVQLYYKTVSPRELGIYAGSSWSGAGERNMAVSEIITKLAGKRGNLGELRRALESYLVA